MSDNRESQSTEKDASIHDLLDAILKSSKASTEELQLLRSHIMSEYERRISENGKLQAEMKTLVGEKSRLQDTLSALQRKDEVSEEQLYTFVKSLSDDRSEMVQSIDRMDRQNSSLKTLLDELKQKDDHKGKAVEALVESNRRLERKIGALYEDGKARDVRMGDMIRRMAIIGKERPSQAMEVEQLRRVKELASKLESELTIEITYLKEIEKLQAELDKANLKYANLASSPLGKLNLYMWKVYNKIIRTK